MSTSTFFRGRREYYRDGRIEFSIDEGARDHLASRMMAEGIHPAVDAIVARCMSASTWGGYRGYHGDQVSRVYVANGGGDSERARRLLSAVGQGAA